MDLITVDFDKAFDKVNLDKLLIKLDSFKVENIESSPRIKDLLNSNFLANPIAFADDLKLYGPRDPTYIWYPTGPNLREMVININKCEVISRLRSICEEGLARGGSERDEKARGTRGHERRETPRERERRAR